MRTTGWCSVLIGIALLLIRRVAGDAVVDALVKVPSNQPAVHDVWNIATSLLYAIAAAMIIYGLAIVTSAWLAGSTHPGNRDSEGAGAVAARQSGDRLHGRRRAAAAARAVGPDAAFRNVWWILLFAGLLALGVTMLRRETQHGFPPGIAPGQPRAQPAHGRAAGRGFRSFGYGHGSRRIRGRGAASGIGTDTGALCRGGGGSRRIAYRDPQHVAERLTLYAAGNLGQQSLEWAHRVREQRRMCRAR